MRQLAWEKIADGRPWRLKHRKHFSATPRAFQAEVLAAAARMGKAVRTRRDEFGRHNYLWVQFADYEVPLGAPCRCGNTALLRSHEFFGRCPACGAKLIFDVPRDELTPEQIAQAQADAAAMGEAHPDPPATLIPRPPSVQIAEPQGHGNDTASEQATHAEPEPESIRPGPVVKQTRLDEFYDVELECYKWKEGSERWAGHGVDAKGRPMLLLIDYPLDEDGQRIEDPERPGEPLHGLAAWPVAPFRDIIEIERRARRRRDR